MHADGDTSQRLRAGGTVLSLLAGPLCVPILRAHLDGPLRLPDLRERIGGAAQTTLRGQVGNLRGVGALERKVRPGMPYTVENELSECGREVLEVSEAVEVWLSRAPQGPIELGSETAKGAIRALVAGWSATVLRVIAARPLSLTEMSGVINDISYPSLERRLSAMRAARQIEVQEDSQTTAKPYVVTEWARQAVGPLMVAGRCECRHLSGQVASFTEADIEAVFLLALPLASLPTGSSGSCLLAVSGQTPEAEQSDGAAGESGQEADGPDQEADGQGAEADESGQEAGDEHRRIVGIQVEVRRGKVTSCVPSVEPNSGSRADGSVEAWTRAVVEGSFDDLSVEDGDHELARPLIEGVRSALWPA